jgi:hypothetical protein
MKYVVLFLAMTLGVPKAVLGQPRACQQVLATLTVPATTYAVANADPFGGRVFVYVPLIKAGGPSGFQPFQVWIVEGIYGRPFLQASGRLDPASFDKLRATANVRATPVSVMRGNGSDAGAFRSARAVYQAQVLRVNASGTGSVQVRICR